MSLSSSHAITADVGIGEVAHAAEFFLSDGVIVTGSATGHAAEPKELQEVKRASRLPVLIGSGVTAENVASFSAADAVIVGSHFKKDGQWQNELEVQRVQRFMDAVRTLRQKHLKSDNIDETRAQTLITSDL